MFNQFAEMARTAALGLSLLVGGLAVGHSASPQPVAAVSECEQDECQEGWSRDYCKNNSGNDTKCSFISQDECETTACNVEEEGD